jgi:hypothetical protein
LEIVLPGLFSTKEKKMAVEVKKAERKVPVTKQEVFEEETKIVRLLLKRVSMLPNETSQMRVLNRVYELREFPLVDGAK